MKAVQGVVYGKVQGVWFRKAVQQACTALDIMGYAKNLQNGCVEVLLVGTSQQVQAGKNIVKKGSPASKVTNIEWLELTEFSHVEGFEIL